MYNFYINKYLYIGVYIVRSNMRDKFVKLSIITVLIVSVLVSNSIVDVSASIALDGKRYDTIEDKEYGVNGEPTYKGYINIYGNLQLNGVNPLKEFDDSMKDLQNVIDDPTTDINATTSTQVNFDSEIDKIENTLKVQIDFAGDVLTQPLNVMFIMDQSGSLNMFAGNVTAGFLSAVSANMNPNHYYQTRVTLTLEDNSTMAFDYYHSPQYSRITGAFSLSVAAISSYATHGMIAENLQGLANNYISPDGKLVHYNDVPADKTGYKRITKATVPLLNTDTPIYISNEKLDPFQCTFPLGTDESNPNFPFEKYVRTLTPEPSWQFYSPELFSSTAFYSDTGSYDDFDSKAYIDEMLLENRAYDRMLLSKILFKDLSNIVVQDNDSFPYEEKNKISHIQFAGEVETVNGFKAAYQEFDLTQFGDDFTRTEGFKYTNYAKAFIKAADFFKNEALNDDGRDPKNVVVFVSDGAPSPEFTTAMMQNFLDSTNAIVYFAGIDLDNVPYEKYKKIIATKDPTTGEYLSYNGTDLDGLIKIRDDVEKLVNASSLMSATIDDNFEIRLDDTHLIELEYRVEGAVDSEIIPIRNLTTDNVPIDVVNKDGRVIGELSYDGPTQKLSWNVTYKNVNNSRLSFYTRVNEDSIDWDSIATGGSLESIVLSNTDVQYINQSGFQEAVKVEDLGDILIEGNSQLRIENYADPITKPGFEVIDVNETEVGLGSEITYTIKVKNEDFTNIVNAHNLLILQKIPDNTTYKEHSDLLNIYDSTNTLIKTIDIKDAYNEDDKEISILVDELNVDEYLEFEYTVEVTKEYSKQIISYAQLGVQGYENTLDATTNEPILQSLYLVHRTPDYVPPKPPHTSNPQTSYYLED